MNSQPSTSTEVAPGIITVPAGAKPDLRPVDACRACGQASTSVFLTGPDWFNGGTQQYTLVRCRNCSLVWLSDRPEPHEMGQHYGVDYDRFISNAGDSQERWEHRQAAIRQYKSGGALLDLGCSSGSFLASLKGQNWRLFGVEMSPEAAKAARAKTGADVFIGDILDAPFAPESFDVITCFDVLEHVYEPDRVLEKVKQWLKPDGVFYMLVPNIDSGEARTFRSYWYGLELPRHLTHFSPESLRQMAHSAGLTELSIESHSNPTVEYSMYHLMTAGLRAIGISRPALAKAPRRGIVGRITRKALRLTFYSVLKKVVSMRGPGESIHAVLGKAQSSYHAR